MALRYLSAFCSLAMVAACSVSASVSSFIERAILVVLATIAEPFAFRMPFASPLVSGGAAAGISPALYQSNRHEAGVSRRAADRNT